MTLICLTCSWFKIVEKSGTKVKDMNKCHFWVKSKVFPISMFHRLNGTYKIMQNISPSSVVIEIVKMMRVFLLNMDRREIHFTKK